MQDQDPPSTGETGGFHHAGGYHTSSTAEEGFGTASGTSSSNLASATQQNKRAIIEHMMQKSSVHVDHHHDLAIDHEHDELDPDADRASKRSSLKGGAGDRTVYPPTVDPHTGETQHVYSPEAERAVQNTWRANSGAFQPPDRRYQHSAPQPRDYSALR